MGDNKYEEIYASVLRLMSPFIDSVGLSEDELAKVSSSLKISSLNLHGILNATKSYEMARMVLETLSISVILVHTSDFSLIVVRKRKN